MAKPEQSLQFPEAKPGKIPTQLLPTSQWPFQEDPKLEVPTIYKAYFSGLCKGISPKKMALYMVQYLQFRILEFPLNQGRNSTAAIQRASSVASRVPADSPPHSAPRRRCDACSGASTWPRLNNVEDEHGSTEMLALKVSMWYLYVLDIYNVCVYIYICIRLRVILHMNCIDEYCICLYVYDINICLHVQGNRGYA